MFPLCFPHVRMLYFLRFQNRWRRFPHVSHTFPRLRVTFRLLFNDVRIGSPSSTQLTSQTGGAGTCMSFLDLENAAQVPVHFRLAVQ